MLNGLPAAAVDLLMKGCATQHAQRDQLLFREGEAADEYLFVVEGEVEVLRHTQDGDERVFQIFDSGRLVAETAMFMTHGRYPMCARARSDAVVLYLRRSSLHEACRAYPELALRMLQRLSDRIYERVNDIEWLSDSTAAERLAVYMLDLQRRMGDPIRLPLTQRQLAAHLGVRAETLSRLLSDWSAQGRVVGARREWALHDQAFLHALAQGARREF